MLHTAQEQEGRRMARSRAAPNVVERAIQLAGGRPIDLAERITKKTGEEITRQRINGWRIRGNFPRNLVEDVHALFPQIPLSDLITYESPIPRRFPRSSR